MNANKRKLLWQKDILFNSFWIKKVVQKGIKKGKKQKNEFFFFKNISSNKSLKLNYINLLYTMLNMFKPLIFLTKYYLFGQYSVKKKKKRFYWVPVPLKYLNQFKKSVLFLNTTLLITPKNSKENFSLIKVIVSSLIFKKSPLIYFNKLLVFKNIKSRAFIYYRWK